MTIKTYTAEEAITAVTNEGCIQIAPGVYLSTQENIIDDQESWGYVDGCKMHDFSSAPFWITDDSGADPTAIHGADEYLEEILTEDSQPDNADVANDMVRDGALDLSSYGDRLFFDQMTGRR